MTNDELQPIENARVRVVDLNVEVVTSVDGAFEFIGVPAGRQIVEGQAPGHTAQSKAVDVDPARPAEVKLILSSLAVIEPRIEVILHTTQIHYGGGIFVNAVPATCSDACIFSMPFSDGPSYALVEITGDHAIGSPARHHGLQVTINKNDLSTGGAGQLHTCPFVEFTSTCDRLPLRVGWNETVLNLTAPKGQDPQALAFNFGCDQFWICLEERYDTYLSAFYHYDEAAIPSDYSARPK